MKTSNSQPPIKIALVDDHSLIKKGIKIVLSFYSDIEVIGDADNGKQLLSMLALAQPDVILLDLQMPVMDGVTTLPQLRKLYPGIKVIIFSMHNDTETVSKLLGSGAHSYLQKDSDPETIYSAIKSCYLS
jgi:DNA-binding NarL/FixJ family response regulator